MSNSVLSSFMGGGILAASLHQDLPFAIAVGVLIGYWVYVQEQKDKELKLEKDEKDV